MFENCGSCFAAEQFVDIKLGAKYLLTLTSFISQNVIYNFIYFDMPFVLGGGDGFSPVPASLFLDFAFLHAVCA